MGREEGSGWGTHVYLWRIHFDIWQNQYNIVKSKKKKGSGETVSLSGLDEHKVQVLAHLGEKPLPQPSNWSTTRTVRERVTGVSWGACYSWAIKPLLEAGNKRQVIQGDNGHYHCHIKQRNHCKGSMLQLLYGSYH